MPPRKKQIPKAVKREVWNKHIGEEIGKSKCKCCEKADITQLNFHCGHIESEAEGGEIHVNNLLPICEVCNKSMGTKNLYEFKKMLVDSNEPKNNSNVQTVKSTYTKMPWCTDLPVTPNLNNIEIRHDLSNFVNYKIDDNVGVINSMTLLQLNRLNNQ
jgi:hypothetical protein